MPRQTDSATWAAPLRHGSDCSVVPNEAAQEKQGSDDDAEKSTSTASYDNREQGDNYRHRANNQPSVSRAQ